MATPRRLTPAARQRALIAVSGVLLAVMDGPSVAGQNQAPTRREFHVTANAFRFAPAVLEVQQGDVVKVTLEAVDIAHSFTVDAYRIAKRANAGQRVVFEFRADRSGRFPFYCNLTLDDRCTAMRGELIVGGR